MSAYTKGALGQLIWTHQEANISQQPMSTPPRHLRVREATSLAQVHTFRKCQSPVLTPRSLTLRPVSPSRLQQGQARPLESRGSRVQVQRCWWSQALGSWSLLVSFWTLVVRVIVKRSELRLDPSARRPAVTPRKTAEGLGSPADSRHGALAAVLVSGPALFAGYS